jgi:hypothetical protein
VSKRDIGSKLKLRLDEWEVYGEKPALILEPVTEQNKQRVRRTIRPGRMEGLAAVPDSGTARVEMRLQSEPIVLPESHVDELQVPLQHGKGSSRRPFDADASEKVSLSAIFQSHAQCSPVIRGAQEPTAWEPNRLHDTYRSVPQSLRGTYPMLIFLAILIGAISFAVVYLLIH